MGDIKPFKMIFNLPLEESKEFREVIQVLLNHNHQYESYNKLNCCLILEGVFFKTCSYEEFVKSPFKEIVYKEFKKKYYK